MQFVSCGRNGRPVSSPCERRYGARDQRGKRPHGNNQRKPNDAELAHAKRLAMSEFLKHGVPAESSKSLKIDRTIVIKVDETAGELLVGSLFVEVEGVRHQIFLVARWLVRKLRRN